MTKLRALMEDDRPSDYKSFESKLMEKVDQKDYRGFNRIIEYAFTTKKYEWFALYFKQNDVGEVLTKELFKQSTPF